MHRSVQDTRAHLKTSASGVASALNLATIPPLPPPIRPFRPGYLYIRQEKMPKSVFLASPPDLVSLMEAMEGDSQMYTRGWGLSLLLQIPHFPVRRAQ